MAWLLTAAVLWAVSAGAVENINWFEKGSEQLKAHQYDEAIAAFTTAIETVPYDYQAYSKRGAARYLKGDYAAAIADYRKAIDINPDDAVALHQLALVLAYCPDRHFRSLHQAARLARRATELNPTSIFVATLAAIQDEAGDPEAAVRTQEKLIAEAKRLKKTKDLPTMEARLAEYRRHRDAARPRLSKTDGKPAQPPPPPAPTLKPQGPVRVRAHPPAKRSGSGRLPARPYTIHIYSFHDRQKANRIAASLCAEGQDAFVAQVDLPDSGRWFRIYVGAYTGRTEAVKAALGLRGKERPYTRAVLRPWTVRVEPGNSDAAPADLEKRLRRLGFWTYQAPRQGEKAGGRDYGAYKTRENAGVVARELRKAGFETSVVPR